uniref:E3 ubiquitin-protein ligase RMA n=1 Tax=Ananas comosus var. bracteatus TaxID=296719 RepID=A0A6V7NMF5_ANACO|nr:unnamed protein product [Ananas comosus var. bracteatus]
MHACSERGLLVSADSISHRHRFFASSQKDGWWVWGIYEQRSPNPSFSSNASSNDLAGSFECNICFELAQDPIVTLCGHLFCWPCLYEWLHVHAHSPECPVCKAIVEEDKLVPLYGRGKTTADPRSKTMPGVQIPNRPTGQRPATAPQTDPNHYANPNPWFVGGARWPMGGGGTTLSRPLLVDCSLYLASKFMDFRMRQHMDLVRDFPTGMVIHFMDGMVMGSRDMCIMGSRRMSISRCC